MIKFMDEIVEAVEQYVKGAGENAIIILGIMAKIVILITVPAWILPYKAIREVLERRANGTAANPKKWRRQS